MVKLLLSILVEAAGNGTSTHRELLTILPSISTEAEMHDLYARTFRSLLVSMICVSHCKNELTITEYLFAARKLGLSIKFGCKIVRRQIYNSKTKIYIDN